ncbi:hypothetical protein ACWEO4_48050 [Streptomyces sp. NPDC004393]
MAPGERLRARDAARAVDIAALRGHCHLAALLRPELKHPLPQDVLARLQQNLHSLIRYRDDPKDGMGPDLATRERLRLPELEVLTELDRPVCWFPVPGMYGGFKFELRGRELVVDSWVRIVGGSELTHRVTVDGVHLQESCPASWCRGSSVTRSGTRPWTISAEAVAQEEPC